MQDVEEYNAVISGLERMPSSANGNPRYMVMLRLADGDVITARTMPDSMEAYGIREGQSVTARIGWHYGKVTIASLEDRTPE